MRWPKALLVEKNATTQRNDNQMWEHTQCSLTSLLTLVFFLEQQKRVLHEISGGRWSQIGKLAAGGGTAAAGEQASTSFCF